MSSTMPDTQPVNRTLRRAQGNAPARSDIFGQVVTRSADDPDAKAFIDSFFQRSGESSNARPPDHNAFGLSVGGGDMRELDPPFIFHRIAELPLKSNMLLQCIAAMVTNTESFGHQLEYIGPEGQEESPKALAEKETFEEILSQPNGEYSLVELRERVRADLEYIGNGFIEAVEDDKGLPTLLFHVPALTMTVTTQEPELVEVEVVVRRGGQDVVRKVKRRFRRYVQTVNGNKVYFKEFGDPRTIDSGSGRIDENTASPASAMFHITLPDQRSVYGAPRWLPQLPAIMGSRESELTNLQFFRDNAIPAMALLVSGGLLTSTSANELHSRFSSTRGRDNQNRLLVIEATGDEQAAADNGQIPPPRIEFKPLAQERQQDALFQEFDKENRRKIRSAFRLPPILVGLSEDHTYDSSAASLALAESQVFGPERARLDRVIEMVLVARLQRTAEYWRYASNAPYIGDQNSTIEAITALNEVGAMTPNNAIQLANEMFDMRVPRIKDPWGNQPFQITLAEQEQAASAEAAERAAQVNAAKATVQPARRADASVVQFRHRERAKPQPRIRHRERDRAA